MPAQFNVDFLLQKSIFFYDKTLTDIRLSVQIIMFVFIASGMTGHIGLMNKLTSFPIK